MSAGIMPDVYRHTARKSTVSKTFKPQANVPLCVNTNSNPPYSTYQNEITSKQATLFDAIECNIKLEHDVSHQQEHQSLFILPDNVTEEMIIGEERESTSEDAIYDTIDQMINQVVSSTPSNQIERTLSIDTRDVDRMMDSMMNQFNPNANEESSSTMTDNSIEESIDRSLVEIPSMENASTTPVISRSPIDSDVTEMERFPSETTNDDNNSHSCTCQCHQPSSPLTNEYILFEQALKQTREEQQHERSLTNNRLIQTLKRQHEELISLYQQNKSSKQIHTSKTDREQQTNALHFHDSQAQTDLTTNSNSKVSPSSPQKSLVVPTANSSSSGPSTVTRNHTVSPLAPRPLATTTVTSKTSTVTTMTTVINNAQPASSLPSPSPTTTSHDVVDLTEEDDEDGTSRTPTLRTAPLRQNTSSSQLPLTATQATATATRIRPANRTIRPNNPTPNGQAFPLRPLPEDAHCDHTIARPQLSISQENATVRLTWNLQSTLMESIQNYEIYAYKQNATVTTSDWKKIGTVKSMRLPMAVTLKEFQSNSHYAFAVRAVSITNHIGPFCEPKTIFTGNTPVQPLHTSQLLNVAT